MICDRIRPITFTAAESFVGLLIGPPCAIGLTRHLTLREDPVGLIGTWVCSLAMGSLGGGILGQMAAQSLGGRGTSGPPRTGCVSCRRARLRGAGGSGRRGGDIAPCLAVKRRENGRVERPMRVIVFDGVEPWRP